MPLKPSFLYKDFIQKFWIHERFTRMNKRESDSEIFAIFNFLQTNLNTLHKSKHYTIQIEV